MSAKLVASVVAGVCGTIFLGYCIYFDRKRRSDPLFKQKLRQSKLVLTNAGCQSARGSQWNLKTLNFICVCAFPQKWGEDDVFLLYSGVLHDSHTWSKIQTVVFSVWKSVCMCNYRGGVKKCDFLSRWHNSGSHKQQHTVVWHLHHINMLLDLASIWTWAFTGMKEYYCYYISRCSLLQNDFHQEPYHVSYHDICSL